MAFLHYLTYVSQLFLRILLASQAIFIDRQPPPDQLPLFENPSVRVPRETPSPPPLPPDDKSSITLRGDENSRVRSAVEQWHVFIPGPNLERLVNQHVREILAYDLKIEPARVEHYAQIISQHAPRLFAILVEAKKGDNIIQILDEHIRDKDLPFIKIPSSEGLPLTLVTKRGAPINTFKTWEPQALENLEVKQHRALSPVFCRHEHYQLGVKDILPFIPNDAESNSWPKVAGGFGEVYPVRIHRDHHQFGTDDLPVAVKRMFYASNFTLEQKAYLDLGPSAHPYIIDLLFTYEYRNNLHLVFLWADGTLLEYWQMNPIPVITPAFFTWTIQQMTGIASGLAYLHEFKDPRTGEPRFGRHGDIKAQNILRFPSWLGPGILKIADLGLARVHGKDSRSNVDPKSVRCSPTYSPPDTLRGCRISRKFDIWSLGAMLLDWISYSLLGYRAIAEFSALRLRGSPSVFPEFRQDTFYTANGEMVNPHVVAWVDKLKRLPHCSQMMHDILDLIMKRMILIVPEMRSSARDITQHLEQILARAQEDQEYLAGPNPLPKLPPIPMRTSCAAELRTSQATRTREPWSTPKSRTWQV
ncbi:kinase-like domain-containing protein [Aspergillus keveii]|uniref:Kinase-like domain-containing protein n=1 Tax=Aspergillus keveii TaxID=714993 RepID=A0ABR4FM28_9EURO